MVHTRKMLIGAVISSLLAMTTMLVSMSAALAEDRIRCAYPYWFGFAPVPVAIELGYFAEEGLEVETVFDNDRANVMPGSRSAISTAPCVPSGNTCRGRSPPTPIWW